MTELWREAILETFQGLWLKVKAFLPNVLAMLTVLVAGFVAAWVIAWIIRRALRALDFDRFCERVGLSAMLSRTGIRTQPTILVSRCAYWTAAFVFLLAGISTLNMAATDRIVSEIFIYIPNLFVAVVVVVLSLLVANFFEKIVLLGAVNAGIEGAHLLARGVRLIIIVFGVAVALDQLAIGRNIILATFTIVFSAVALALALAFGLGAKEIARRYLEEKLVPKAREGSGPDEIQHL